MVENVIYETLNIENDYKSDLSLIFKKLKNLDSKLLLAINTYITYILYKRGVLK